jgi:hypothetical protein
VQLPRPLRRVTAIGRALTKNCRHVRRVERQSSAPAKELHS